VAAAAVPANAPGRVVVELLGLTSDAGQVLAALFRNSTGFPEEPQRAQQRKLVKIKGRRVELAFDNVPPGLFAVSLFHDEDANGKMKTGMFGIPSEGYGFTRDARGSFGPPSFEDARLQLSAGEAKKVTIHMKY
ncbi:MAG TPA: DUF2141 domain-containing protein, partial [Polyangiales bacterium]|nr:DUF2141 domain-containing protein [Polyangiales bacterium]